MRPDDVQDGPSATFCLDKDLLVYDNSVGGTEEREALDWRPLFNPESQKEELMDSTIQDLRLPEE